LWDTFWQTQPQRARLLLFPRARRAPAALPPPDATSARSAPPVVAPTPALAAVPPADVPPVPRPLRPVADYPWRRQPLGRAFHLSEQSTISRCTPSNRALLTTLHDSCYNLRNEEP